MIRLDKYIADAAGLTRSEAGKAIRSGAVAVDGTVLRKPERKIDEAAAAVSLNGMPCVWRRLNCATYLPTSSEQERYSGSFGRLSIVP